MHPQKQQSDLPNTLFLVPVTTIPIHQPFSDCCAKTHHTCFVSSPTRLHRNMPQWSNTRAREEEPEVTAWAGTNFCLVAKKCYLWKDKLDFLQNLYLWLLKQRNSCRSGTNLFPFYTFNSQIARGWMGKAICSILLCSFHFHSARTRPPSDFSDTFLNGIWGSPTKIFLTLDDLGLWHATVLCCSLAGDWDSEICNSFHGWIFPSHISPHCILLLTCNSFLVSL